MSDEEVEKMFEAVDTDKSGFIDYSEFVVAAMNENQLTTNEKLQAAFKMFDKDGSGIISPEEIKEVLSFGGTNQLSKGAIDAIVKQVDENGDGEISFEEFVDMMKKMAEWSRIFDSTKRRRIDLLFLFSSFPENKMRKI